MVVKKGGNKAKKQKKIKPEQTERTLEFKDVLDFQEYAQVLKVYGNNRYEASCVDGKTRLAHSRGNLKKKKVFVKHDDGVSAMKMKKKKMMDGGCAGSEMKMKKKKMMDGDCGDKDDGSHNKRRRSYDGCSDK